VTLSNNCCIPCTFVSLVLQIWRAITEKQMMDLLTHAQKSFMEVSRWEEQIRLCADYIDESCHGQDQL